MAEPTTNGPLDPAALAALVESTGGDPEFLGELIDVYLADGAELLATMEAALAAGDAAALRRAAHTLKSTSATFGAGVLAETARAIEAGARERVPADAAELVEKARAEFARVEGALAAARAAL